RPARSRPPPSCRASAWSRGDTAGASCRPSSSTTALSSTRTPAARGSRARESVYGVRRLAYSSTTRSGSAALHEAVQAFRYLNIAAYIALGVVTLVSWRRRRDRASRWAAVTFGTLGVLELLSLVPNHPGNLSERAVGRVDVALLVLFPYLLFRFTNAFRTPHRRLADALVILTAALVVWTFALPSIPQSGEERSPGFQAFVYVFFVHWTVLSVVSAVSLWRAGREQSTVARRRMQFLAFATAAITLALLLAVFTVDLDSALSLGSQILATMSVAAFFVGFAPPSL